MVYKFLVLHGWQCSWPAILQDSYISHVSRVSGSIGVIICRLKIEGQFKECKKCCENWSGWVQKYSQSIILQNS